MNIEYVDLPLEISINKRTKDLDIIIVPKSKAGIKKAKKLQKNVLSALRDDDIKENFSTDKNVGVAFVIALLLIALAVCNILY